MGRMIPPRTPSESGPARPFAWRLGCPRRCETRWSAPRSFRRTRAVAPLVARPTAVHSVPSGSPARCDAARDPRRCWPSRAPVPRRTERDGHPLRPAVVSRACPRNLMDTTSLLAKVDAGISNNETTFRFAKGRALTYAVLYGLFGITLVAFAIMLAPSVNTGAGGVLYGAMVVAG